MLGSQPLCRRGRRDGSPMDACSFGTRPPARTPTDASTHGARAARSRAAQPRGATFSELYEGPGFRAVGGSLSL